MNMAAEPREQYLKRRAWVLTGLALAGFLVIVFRCFLIQVAQRDHYLKLSNKNRLKAIPIEAMRGLILDRRGRLLVDNRAAYSVALIPLELKDKDQRQIVAQLARLLGLDPAEIQAKIKKGKARSFEPIRLQRNVDFGTLSVLEENREKFPGVICQVEPERVYLHRHYLAHVLGYIDEMTEKEAKTFRKQGYLSNDLIGRSGVEKTYEPFLHGTPGMNYYEVNAVGRKIGEVEENYTPPQSGHNLWLTIDLDLQETAEVAMPDSLRGALVALDPVTGEILALVNRPSIDPNIFSGRISPERWRQMNNSETKPLLNRAIQGLYPPGSTYKMVTAVAGLETGHLDLHTLFRSCTGEYAFGNRVFRCWLARGHGRLDVNEAIAQSCDVFFYQLAVALGLENLADYARRFWFGQPTGVDLHGELAGLVPDREYFDKRYGKSGWSKGNLLSLGIGQGDILVTPLQMAQYAAFLATGGSCVPPHLMKKIVAADGKTVREYAATARSVRGVSAKSFEIVKKAMVDVVGHGTATACALPGIVVAGKTGSAENPHGKTHAWFIAFAPAEAPRLALAVLVENAGHGGEVAVPIARQVLARYFNSTK